MQKFNMKMLLPQRFLPERWKVLRQFLPIYKRVCGEHVIKRGLFADKYKKTFANLSEKPCII